MVVVVGVPMTVSTGATTPSATGLLLFAVADVAEALRLITQKLLTTGQLSIGLRGIFEMWTCSIRCSCAGDRTYSFSSDGIHSIHCRDFTTLLRQAQSMNRCYLRVQHAHTGRTPDGPVPDVAYKRSAKGQSLTILVNCHIREEHWQRPNYSHESKVVIGQPCWWSGMVVNRLGGKCDICEEVHPFGGGEALVSRGDGMPTATVSGIAAEHLGLIPVVVSSTTSSEYLLDASGEGALQDRVGP